MEQTLLTEGKLLNENGDLVESGYSTQLVRQYNRNDIKAGKMRIKEWDYYYFGNNKYGVALTVADNSYMALMSVSTLDFENKSQTTTSLMKWFTKGKIGLPSTSAEGNVIFKNKKGYSFEFLLQGKTRILKVNYPNFKKGETFTCELTLNPTNKDTMVIATPFDKKKHFYYNQKMNLLNGEGFFTVGNKKYEFKKEDSYGVLDWGRGVWTYQNTWYWGSLNCIENGKRIGLNLGYGFGCNKNATENMLFIDDKALKIDIVQFNYQLDRKSLEDFSKPVRVTSNDGILDLIFEPLFDRHADTNAVFIRSNQHQVFGRYSGTIKIGNEEIIIKNQVGFIEKVFNRW